MIPDPNNPGGWLDNPKSGCTGWVPFRFIRELPKSIETTVINTRNFDANIHPDSTPFNGMEMRWQTIKELAKLYGDEYDAMLMERMLELNMIVLRDIFHHRFGDNGCIWWEHYKSELDRLRTKKLAADQIFLLMDVALCEEHLRNEVKDFLPKSRKALKTIDQTFETLIKKLPPIVLFSLGVSRALKSISSEAKQRVEKYYSVGSKAKSPLLHLVNVRIIEMLKKAGLIPNQAYHQAARLYIGFDFFSDKTFNLANSRDPNALEREVINRAKRVQSSYDYWRGKRNRIKKKLMEYDRMFA